MTTAKQWRLEIRIFKALCKLQAVGRYAQADAVTERWLRWFLLNQ